MSSAYTGAGDITGNFSLSYLDSPNTTSSKTYQIYFRSQSSGQNAYLNTSNTKSSITVMEIKG